MEKPESKFDTIMHHLQAAFYCLGELKLHDYMDRIEELMGDLEEEELRARARPGERYK